MRLRLAQEGRLRTPSLRPGRGSAHGHRPPGGGRRPKLADSVRIPLSDRNAEKDASRILIGSANKRGQCVSGRPRRIPSSLDVLPCVAYPDRRFSSRSSWPVVSNCSGALPDGAAEGGGDEAPAQSASDDAKRTDKDATVDGPDDGSVRGDAPSGPTLVPDGGKAVPPDSGVCSTSCTVRRRERRLTRRRGMPDVVQHLD